MKATFTLSKPSVDLSTNCDLLLRGAEQLADRARFVIRARALALCCAWLLVFVCAVLVADVLLRPTEAGMRWLALIATSAFAVYQVQRWVRPAWRISPTRTDVANWLEAREAIYADNLQTAIELAELSKTNQLADGRYGSPGFHQAALERWFQTHPIPAWGRYLDSSRGWSALAGLLLAIIVAAGLFAYRPQESRLALWRLVMPFTNSPWPRADSLELVDPPGIAALGSDLQIEVRDQRPPLPENVVLHVRQVDVSATAYQVIPTTQIGELAIGNLPSLTAAVEVRAAGGDDTSMRWHRIEVVEPPHVEQMQFQVMPPGYSGLPSYELTGSRIEVLAGSEVLMVGGFSTAVSGLEAEFQVADPPTASGQATFSPASAAQSSAAQSSSSEPPKPLSANSHVSASWSAALRKDRRTFELGVGAAAAAGELSPGIVMANIRVHLDVVLVDGLRVRLPETWHVECRVDQPPVLNLETSDLKVLSTRSQIRVAGLASDDLELGSVAILVKRVGDDEPFLAIPVPGREDSSQQCSIDQLVELDGQASLTPGEEVEVWVEAVDSLQQVSQSQRLTYQIETDEAVLSAIAGQQSELLREVQQLVQLQRMNQAAISRTQRQLASEDGLREKDVKQLNDASQVQQSIANQLKGGDSSTLTRVESIRESLVLNDLADASIAQQLQDLGQALDGLAQGAMRQASESTREAAASASSAFAEQANSATGGVAAKAQAAVQDQRTVLRQLEGLQDQMARDEALELLGQDLARMASIQTALQQSTDDMQVQSIVRDDTSALAELENALVTEQGNLALRFDDFLRRAEGIIQTAAAELDVGASPETTLAEPASMRQTDAQQTDMLRRAVDALQQQDVSAEMRRALDGLAQEQFAEAATSQSKIARAMQAALEQLGRGRGAGPAGISEATKLARQSSQELERLANAQADLAQRMGHLEADANAAAEQARLEAAVRQAAELASQNADAQASSQLNDAADTQASVVQALEASDPSREKAAQLAQQAAQELQQVAQAMNRRAAQLQRELQKQQAMELVTQLEDILETQTRVLELALRWEDSDAASADDLDSLAKLIVAEQSVAKQRVAGLRHEASELPTFDWTLQQIETDMGRVVAATLRGRVAPQAVDSAREAVDKLAMVLTALEEQTPPSEEEMEHAEPGESSDEDSGRRMPPIASLKLLLALQEDLQRKTIQLEESAETPGRAGQLAELAQQQQALATQLMNLLEEMADVSAPQ